MFEQFNEKYILNKLKQNVDNGIDTSEGTFTHDVLSPSANEISRLYSMMDHALSQAFLTKAEGSYLTDKAKEFGVERKGAQKAVGTVRFTGKEGVIITKNSIVSTVSGLQYETVEPKSISVGATFADVKVESLGYGKEYNINAFEIKSLNTSISGIEKVENLDSFVGSSATETDSDLRKRTFQKINYPTASGNANHYREWASEVNGIGAVKVLPTWNGPGTVKLIILDSQRKAANQALIDNTKAHVEKNRPIGATVEVTTARIVNIQIIIDIKQTGSALMEDIKKLLTERVNKYLDTIAFELEKVSYNKLVAILETLVNEEVVSDYRNVRINGLGVGQDLILEADQIPVLERIDLNAYN